MSAEYKLQQRSQRVSQSAASLYPPATGGCDSAAPEATSGKANTRNSEPVRSLLASAAIARAARQFGSRNWKSEIKSATCVDFDAASGMYRVQLSDGSIAYAATNTNGAITAGDAVELHAGGGMLRVDAPPAKKTILQPARNNSLAIATFKVLFSVVEGNIQKFYLGGDRSQPLLIFEIDTNIYAGYETDTGSSPYYISGYIANTGTKKDDWVVGIRFSKWDPNRFSEGDDIQFLCVILPKKDDFDPPADSYDGELPGISIPDTFNAIIYSDYETTGIGLLRWRGAGLWISDLQELLASRFYWWEFALEEFTSAIDFQDPIDQTTRPLTVNTATATDWEFNTAFVPPFPALGSYPYSKTDHTGIREASNQTPMSTNEVWNRTGNPDFYNNYSYHSPANSYIQSLNNNIFSSISHSVLTAPSKPYSYTSYTQGNYTENFPMRADIITFTYFGSASSSQSLSVYRSGYFALDGVRKYLLINTSGSIAVTKENYTMQMTEGFYSGLRYQQLGGDYQDWNRKPYIYDVFGKNYLFANKTIEDATSKRSNDLQDIKQRLNGVTATQASPTPSRIEQNYAETMLIDSKLQVCLFKKLKTDSTAQDVHLVIPTSTKYYIYNSANNTETEIDGTISVNLRTNTFVNKGGYKRIYFEQMPNQFKTENALITPKVQKYIKDSSTFKIEETIGAKVLVRSLKIDTAKTHYIHNISFYQP